MNIPESILSNLTNEQKKKITAAQSPEELLALAKEFGYELSPDQLESIAGGKAWRCNADTCPEFCYFWGI